MTAMARRNAIVGCCWILVMGVWLLVAACSRSPGDSALGAASGTPTSAAPDPTRQATVEPLERAVVVADPGRIPIGGDPVPCRDVFQAWRCDLITSATAEELHVKPGAIVSVRIIPEPVATDANGRQITVMRGGGTPLNVRATLANGKNKDVYVGCAGVDSRPICVGIPPTPLPLIGGSYGQGHDLPCPGAPPDGCATPVPSPDPRLAADAQPIRVSQLDIPIDHIGDYRIELGRGSIPNGRLTESTYGFADERPAGVTIMEHGPRLEIESLEPDGKPFFDVYEHGWRPGLERIVVYLTFHVDAFEPGAVISLRGVVVR